MANPFKSFTPYRVLPEVSMWLAYQFLDGFDERMAREFGAVKPEGQRWRTVGFTSIGGKPYLRGQPDPLNDMPVYLMMVRFYERILPGVVIKEAMAPTVARLEKEYERKLTRQELAEVRTAVEEELLPKAFIRATDVPVIYAPEPDFSEGLLMICSASVKRCDDVMSFLLQVFNDCPQKGKFRRFKTQRQASALFREIATSIDGESDPDEEGLAWLKTGFEVVCKGQGQRAVRVKGSEIEGPEFMQLLQLSAYEIKEIGLSLIDRRIDEEENEPEAASFVVSDSLTFKQFTIHNPTLRRSYLNEEDAAEGIKNYVVGLSGQVKTVIAFFVAKLGGLAFDPPLDGSEDDPLDGSGPAYTTLAGDDDDDEI